MTTQDLGQTAGSTPGHLADLPVGCITALSADTATVDRYDGEKVGATTDVPVSQLCLVTEQRLRRTPGAWIGGVGKGMGTASDSNGLRMEWVP
ncbi:hypothetical protein [Streptomyces sp. NPDC013457]|uniref:hypothetical protein n=1 Tax=Streptomyces sp. NPDC013457 TaxID=3364866 RepID=UPI0036FB3628